MSKFAPVQGLPVAVQAEAMPTAPVAAVLEVVGAARPPADEQLRRLGARVFWRETTAQHFETEFGLWYARTTRPCRQVVNATHLWARNARINRHLRRVNVSVLPALDLSLQYWAAHLERRTAYMRAMRAKPAADCTHFCEPSSLFARLNADLVAAVARGEG